jgi:hypothetical protein
MDSERRALLEDLKRASKPNFWTTRGAAAILLIILFILFIAFGIPGSKSPQEEHNELIDRRAERLQSENERARDEEHFSFDADEATDHVMNRIMSTSEGRAEVERLANKDDELTRFQRIHGISDAVAEAAIMEWVVSHNGNFDWNLDEVKAICLRLNR